MTTRRWTLSAESITAVAAVFAALVALAVGVWENVQSRRHQRLSVQPYLDFIAEVTGPDSLRQVALSLTNAGVGPGRVETLDIRVIAGPDSVATFSSWVEAGEAIAKLGLSLGTHVETPQGFMLPAGERQILAVLRGPLGSGDETVLDGLRRLGIVVGYTSIYEEPFLAVFNTEIATDTELTRIDAD